MTILDIAGWKAHRSIALAWRRGSSTEAALRVIADHVRGFGRAMLDGVPR